MNERLGEANEIAGKNTVGLVIIFYFIDQQIASEAQSRAPRLPFTTSGVSVRNAFICRKQDVWLK